MKKKKKLTSGTYDKNAHFQKWGIGYIDSLNPRDSQTKSGNIGDWLKIGQPVYEAPDYNSRKFGVLRLTEDGHKRKHAEFVDATGNASQPAVRPDIDWAGIYFIIYQVQGTWYKTSAGWLPIDERTNKEAKFRKWQDVLKTPDSLLYSIYPADIYYYGHPDTNNQSRQSDHKVGITRYKSDLPSTLTVLRTEGDWMLVIADEHSWPCGYGYDDDASSPTGRLGWIKYMDENGSPMVYPSHHSCR